MSLGKNGHPSHKGSQAFAEDMIIMTKLRISAIAVTLFLLIFIGNIFFLTSALQEEYTAQVVMFFGIACMGISIWCLYASMAIVTSLRELKKGADIIANGNVDYALNVKSHDEIGQLAQSLNTMALKLKQGYAKLEQRARDEIRDSEAVKGGDDAMLANISDGVIATDDHGFIVVINNAALRSLGLERKRVIGKKAIEVIFMQDEEGKPLLDSERPIQKVLATGKGITTTVSTPYYYVRANKERFPAAITATPVTFNFNGKMIRMIEIFRDVTKEKEIDRQKNEFISIASHQLRTPLGSMRWNLELLASEIACSPKEAQERLGEIYKSNRRVIRLVGDLLDVSRIEQGRVEDEPESTNVSEIVANAIKEMDPEANEKSVSIAMKIKKSDTPDITIDAKRFREVIQNLLANAVRYTPPHGHVFVEIDHTDHSLEIAVSDTGIGIPEQEKPRIFSKFARAQNATIVDTEGSGLGLYIVKSYIMGWGGAIRFESKEGKGTTFYISLPLTPIQGTEHIQKNL